MKKVLKTIIGLFVLYYFLVGFFPLIVNLIF